MSRQCQKILKPHEIVSGLHDILHDESDGKPLEYSDDDYILESHFISSCDESEDTQRQPQGNKLYYLHLVISCY